MKRNSLTLKLLVATGFALVGTAIAVTAIAYVVITYFPNVWLEADLVSNAEEVAAGLVYDAADRPIALHIKPSLNSAYSVLQQDMLYRIVDAQGRVLLAADSGAGAFAPMGQAFDPALARFTLPLGENLMHVATFALDRPGTTYYLQLARSERFHHVLTNLESDTAGEAALAAIIMAQLIFSAIVFFTIRRVLKPLQAASQAAARITPDNRHARLSAEGMPGELVPLIDALNQALERLSVGYEVQQEFLATAAHELKTPLALMRGTVELGDSPERAALLVDIDGMSRQVQQLLQLAECSEARNYTMAPTDMARVVNEAADRLGRLAAKSDVRIEATIHHMAAPCLLHADGAAVFILLRNLLENAIRFAPAGSAVEVALSEKGLAVRDRGAGIKPQDRALVFKRYWRGGGQNSQGSGLGLAICQEIVLAHGWTIEAQDAAPGARFWVGFGVR